MSEKKVYEHAFQSYLREEGATNIHGVPYIYECLERDGFFDRIPQTIRLMTMGGGRANPALHERLNRITQRQKISFYAMYGQTEGTCILTKVPNEQEQNEPGCIGVSALGTKAFLDEDTGELCFKSPGVCLGYATSWEDLSRGDDNCGILRTGDSATIDKSGRIYLTGRLKRFLKMKGVRINLDDVEEYLRTQFGIHSACVGNDDDLVCYAVSSNTDSVGERISSQFKISRRMIAVHAISDIPRTPQGKTDYSLLQ